MKSLRIAVLMCGAALLCACNLQPEAPDGLPPAYVVAGSPGTYALFDACKAVRPFEVGETVAWRRGAQRDQVTFIEQGACSNTPDGSPTRYRISIRGTVYSTSYEFFEVRDTPEDDYIVQMVTPNEDFPGVVFAFLLRTRDGVEERLVMRYDDLSPRARRLCVTPTFARPHPAYVFRCEFDAARDVARYYREVVYPSWRNSEETSQ